MKKRSKTVSYALYFFLVLLLLSFLFIYAFGLMPMQADSFTRFLLILIFVLLMLPTIAHIKFFDVIDVRRDVKMFKQKVNSKINSLKRK